MIRKITNSIVLDGQLDSCELTFSELERIQEALLRLLVSMYHHRVDYPGFDFRRPKREQKSSGEIDARKIARYRQGKIEKLLADAGIVRNRLKVTAAVGNAKAFLKVQKEWGSFAKYIWHFTGGKTICNRWRSLQEVPAKTAEAEAMSKDLKKRGFKFVGPTICYAFMQAVGMVNDHVVGCYRHKELSQGEKR